MPRKTFTQRLKGENIDSLQNSSTPEVEVTLEPKSQESRVHELEQKVIAMENKIESLLEVLNQYPFLTAKHKGNKLPL